MLRRWVSVGEGCLAGAGSSELDDELLDSEDEDDDVDLDLRVPAGEFSASSSSRDAGRGLTGACRGGGLDDADGPDDIPGPNGGSSICIHCALLSSAAVGVSPKSMYRCPGMSAVTFPMSARMSIDLVSKRVAILKCSGAALIRVPP